VSRGGTCWVAVPLGAPSERVSAIVHWRPATDKAEPRIQTRIHSRTSILTCLWSLSGGMSERQ